MRSNSQILQDIFVDFMLQKYNGFFLDIGAGNGGLKDKPISFMSNTFSLEFHKGWNGLCIDFDEDYVKKATLLRKSKAVCADLTKSNINSILHDQKAPKDIDYLSLDVDDATEYVLDTLNFNEYRFKIITYEHNIFQAQGTSNQVHSEEHKAEVLRLHEKSRAVFEEHGYRLLFGNVGLRGFGYVEDWYVDPLYFNNECLDMLQSNDIFCEDVIKKIMSLPCSVHQTSRSKTIKLGA